MQLEARSVPSPAASDLPALTVGELFDRWSADRADKRAPNTIKRYRGSIRSFEAFAKGRDVRTLTGDDVFAWAVHRRDVEGISPRAINKNDLVAVSSVVRWGAGRASGQRLSSNPATGIPLDEPRIARQRERTFRDGEIAAILSAALAVQPDPRNPTLSFAKRWCPWLAAYSGARIAELTHLEQCDIRTGSGSKPSTARGGAQAPRSHEAEARQAEPSFLIRVSVDRGRSDHGGVGATFLHQYGGPCRRHGRGRGRAFLSRCTA